ncbi:EAL domain-containing protein [Marinomonas sp. 2405UD66-6]|uniref:bifunctional diguanylate cyclase/phosphodiesterase n=1 Tax=Marinomonas sp. 2405UD66-6 TaxID=3391834 RepID=UPI0039C8DF09
MLNTTSLSWKTIFLSTCFLATTTSSFLIFINLLLPIGSHLLLNISLTLFTSIIGISYLIAIIKKQSNKHSEITAQIATITQLKEESDKNNANLEHALEISEEGLWKWNPQTDEVLHNKQWTLICGTGKEQQSFEDFDNCVFPEDKEKVYKEIEKLLQHNIPFNLEYRLKHPDGKIIWVWDRASITEYDEENNPVWIVGLSLDITAKKQNQEMVSKFAYYDQLTGLANRIYFENALANTAIPIQQNNHYSVLLFLDLDRFKLLNDSYGHHMGDKLLEEIAHRLTVNKQPNTTVSRFGGDEFAVLFPALNTNQATTSNLAKDYANQLIQNLSAPMELKSDVQDIQIKYAITTSIGGIVFKSNELPTEKLLQLADIALYRAKAHGGNSAVIFDNNMTDDLQYTVELQKSLHQSVLNQDFCIYLQPKYSVHHKIIGAEALVRWEHPELGTLAPAAFMEMAEESNMILPIGKLVLEQACQQLKEWQSSPETEHLEISVNLSAKQIWQDSFVEDFIQVIESHTINQTKLILEVTESVLIRDINDATEKLNQLKEYGLSISLDDFGTGFSSLSYLRSLPIDEIKIDRSFIQDMNTDPQAYIMLKSIIGLASNFNLKVVSEGVEEKEQLEQLKALGILIFQGFYFSKPINKKQLAVLLQQNINEV